MKNVYSDKFTSALVYFNSLEHCQLTVCDILSPSVRQSMCSGAGGQSRGPECGDKGRGAIGRESHALLHLTLLLQAGRLYPAAALYDDILMKPQLGM